MICVRCHKDCNYPERTGKKCPTCKGAFAFEPREGDPISDQGFKNCIDAASSLGTVRFLPDHVYYQYVRRKARGSGARAAFLTLGAFSLPFLFVSPIAAIPAVLFGAIGLGLGPHKVAPVGRGTFEGLWQRWLQVHEAPKGLIVRREQPPYRGASDIEQYSFDRAVICDRSETVDLLIANNFHFENNCAVLSVDGYPQHAFPTVKGMLKRNPRLTVYALHDATFEGCTLAHMLASSRDWFFRSARVVEVGLRPEQAKRHPGCWQELVLRGGSVSAPVTRSERAWLERYALELSAIRPEQVIKRLYAAIAADEERAKKAPHGTGDGGVYVGSDVGDHPVVDASSMSTETTAVDGGYDSFG